MAVERLRGSDPRRIGPYRVMKRLGGGGMGMVYLGVSRDGRQVAVKVIRAEHAADPEFRTRFEREVAAARRVRGFCTAPIVDADPAADPPYLVTEFVNGPSLHDMVANEGPLPTADLEALAVGAAAALTAIHDAGVVHRDLKPANVMLSPFGPRVIDFGVAQVMDLTRLSVAGAVLGTPAYMAPEQLRGEPVTAAADVFAWGAVVAFAASGEPPFRGRSPAALMHQILTAEADLSSLDGVLRDQVRAAMSKTSNSRPTAHEILKNLISSGAPAAAAGVLDAATMSAPADREAASAELSGANDADEAEVWYRRAADAGDVEATRSLGFLLMDQNRCDEAEVWFRRAAEAGDPEGMTNLGFLLAEFHDRQEEAELWYRKAADAGEPHAMKNLGLRCEERNEIDEAKHWLRRAADAGHVDGMRHLARLLTTRGTGNE